METKDHEATHSPQQSIQLSSSTVQQDQNQKGLPLQQQQQQEDEQQPQKYQTDNIRVPSQLPSNYDFTTTTETISSSYVMPLSNIQGNSQYQNNISPLILYRHQYHINLVTQAQRYHKRHHNHQLHHHNHIQYPCIINILDRVYRMISYNYILQFMNQEIPIYR